MLTGGIFAAAVASNLAGISARAVASNPAGISAAGVALNLVAGAAIGLLLRGAALGLARAEVAGSSLLAAEVALIDLSPLAGAAVAASGAATLEVAAENGRAGVGTTGATAGEIASFWL
jgi:hypothetical protein